MFHSLQKTYPQKIEIKKAASRRAALNSLPWVIKHYNLRKSNRVGLNGPSQNRGLSTIPSMDIALVFLRGDIISVILQWGLD
jgi:hypothetical protein